MKKSYLIAGALIILVTFIFSCSENDCPTCPKKPDKAYVEGTVYSFFCYPLDPPIELIRHTTNTGEKARLRFYKNDSLYLETLVGDSSDYQILIDNGTYDIIALTNYTFPDTFPEVCLCADTAIDFNLKLDWIYPDTMLIGFYTMLPGDTLGQDIELQYISRLDTLLGNIFDIENCRNERYVNQIHFYYSNTYYIGFETNDYAYETFLKAIDNIMDPPNNFPEIMEAALFIVLCYD